MKFNSNAGQEARTWILFFVGIGLAVIFALKGNPLNPWWTLVIGAFTSTAIIVSAVQAVTGGIRDANRKDTESKSKQEQPRSDPPAGPKESTKPTLSISMGPGFLGTLCGFRSSNTTTVQ